MRVLYLAPGPPSPTTGGGSLRMFQMIKFLGRRVELDLVAPAGPGADAAEQLCKPYCAEVEFVSPRFRPALRRLVRLGPYETDAALLEAVHRRLRTGAYEAIHVEKPAMLPYVPTGHGIPIILDTWAYGLAGARRALRHERGVLTRLRNLVQLVRFAAFDRFCWPELHAVLVVSEIDRVRCSRDRPGQLAVVVPNGVDCETFRPKPMHPGGPPALLFSGDMSFAPNVEAAVFLATRLFPEIQRGRPDARLLLVGRRPTGRLQKVARPGITVIGEVPDMLPYLQDATLYLAPLFTGAGTRTKLLEAMAAALPVITTSTGIEGIEAAPGKEVLVADTPRDLVAATLAMLEDPNRARAFGTAGRRLVERHYDWSMTLKPLEALYGPGLCRHPEAAAQTVVHR